MNPECETQVMMEKVLRPLAVDGFPKGAMAKVPAPTMARLIAFPACLGHFDHTAGHEGNSCPFWAEILIRCPLRMGRKSVTVSVGTPLCPYGIAYRGCCGRWQSTASPSARWPR